MVEQERFPERRARDHTRSALDAAISVIPWVGGAGTQLLEVLLPASVEKRRDRWFNVLDERLRDVEHQVLDDERFQTLVLEASKAALGTHLEEKLRLLAAAVQSSADALARGDDDFMAMRLLAWVADLDPIHFQVLGAIRNDDGWGGQVGWEAVLDRVRVDDDEWYEVLDDLTRRRLVGSTGFNPDLPTSEYRAELIWVTNRGAELVRFVQMMVDDPS